MAPYLYTFSGTMGNTANGLRRLRSVDDDDDNDADAMQKTALKDG